MSDEREGLPLAEAIGVYGDPDLWVAYEEAERAAAGKRRTGYFVIGDAPIVGPDVAARIDRNNSLVAARDRAWRTVVGAFWGRLQSGDLVATGMKVPLNEYSRPIVIARELWSELTLGISRSSAKGPGIAFVNVRVWKGRGAVGADQPRALVPKNRLASRSLPGPQGGADRPA